MTDPTFTNRREEGDVEFIGFAGLPVESPPSWAYDELAEELDSERQEMLSWARRDHYDQTGVHHATKIVDRLIEKLRGIKKEGIDLNNAVTQFDLTEWQEQDDYADGLLTGLEREANTLESTTRWIDRGIGTVNHSHASVFFARIAGLPGPEFRTLFQEIPGAADGDPAGVAELYRRAGGLSQQEVGTLVDQIDQLTRALSWQVRRPLPNRLQAADRHQQLSADAVGLAATIDQLSVLRALPSLMGDQPTDRLARRELLAAHVAAACATDRQLLYHLPADRAAIVKELLPPRFADQTLDSTAPETEPASRELTDLRTEVDTLLTALTDGSREGSSKGSSEDLTQLAAEIAAQYQRDPTLTRQLPSTQAGLVRHLAMVFEDAALQTPPPDPNRKRRVNTSPSHQALAQPATTAPPGTAGSRHAATTPSSGTARSR